MIHDVIAAAYKGGYRIELQFDDGECGEVDFAKSLDRGGVFQRLKDPELFRGFSVNEELGTLTWEGELDIAPETLYAEATGRGLPDWKESEESNEAKQPLHSGPKHDTRF